MNPTLRFLRLFFILTALAALLSWQTQTALDRLPKPLRLGVSHGTEAEIAYKVREIALQQNLSVDIFVYGDYLKLNESLSKGELDAVSFQPLYYLEAVNRDLGYGFVPLQNTIFSPLGIYCRETKKDAENFQPPKFSTFLLAKETQQQSRSLEFLKTAGLINLSVPAGALATLSDISANPLQLEIKTLSEDELLRKHLTSEYAVLNAAQAKSFAWQPQPDALLLEKPSPRYAHVLAIRHADQTKSGLQELAQIYGSDELRQYISEVYKGRWISAVETK